MQLRQPSQKAWPHVTSMRGTTPSLRRTASQRDRASRPQEGRAIQKHLDLDLDLVLAYKT
jgi:hypothetical protein